MKTDPAPHDPPVRCPRCQNVMRRIHLHEGLAKPIHIDRCEQCHGVWLDRGEREKIAASKAAARRADPTGAFEAHSGATTPLACPRDRSQMIRMVDPKQSHVSFESCTVCGGSFLDAGEMHDLAHLNILERIRSWLP